MRKPNAVFACIIALLLVLIPSLLVAQTPGDFEKKGDYYFEQCKKYVEKDPDSLVYFSQLAMEQFGQAENWEKYMNGRNAMSVGYFTLGNYTLAQKNALKAIEEAGQYLGEHSRGMSDALSNYSVFLRELGDHNKSITYLERALKIQDKLKIEKQKTATIINLGTVYARMGDADEALKYYFKITALRKENPECLSMLNEANTYHYIGNVFIEKGELDVAKTNFRKCLEILSVEKWSTKNRGHGLQVETSQDMAEVFLKQNNADSVYFYINQSIDLAVGVCYNHRDRSYEILGKFFSERKNYSKAIDYFLKSKTITVDKFSAYEKHYAIAEKDIFLANTYQEAKDFNAALKHYQLALQMLSHDDIENDVHKNPGLNNIYSRLNFLAALSGKAHAFYQIYQDQKREQDLVTAYETFQLATQLIQDIRQDYEQEGSLLRLSTRVLPIYESAIEVAIELNRITGKETYLHDAFVFSESNKAILLLESMNESKAKSFAGIPDSLLEKENDLRIELSFLKRKLNEEINKGDKGRKKVLANINAELFDMDQAYKNLISKFESKYPEYHQLKYNTKLVSVQDVQQKLAEKSTTLVEYFFGDDKIYVFSITSNSIKVNQIDEKNELLTKIQKVRRFLSVPPQHQNGMESYNEYAKCAHFLFQKLLAHAITPDTKHLIIIADDQLGYLPFGVLLVDLPSSKNALYSLKKLSYLLEDYEISYSYSATLFCNNYSLKREKAGNVFLGVAPAFGAPQQSVQRLCDEEYLYSLNCSRSEVETIKELLGGKILLDKDASKNIFEKEAGQCQILHLATHACLDDENPRFSKIYLTDDYISNNDLYNLQLKSDLAVLSACDTGSGQLAKGEGVMSLARGFIHAGCPSVVMSLWSVDDCATSDIMVGFYKNLYEGKTKSEAIRQAKLDYLATSMKAEQHPYYWAAFIQIGNFEPLSFQSDGMSFNNSVALGVVLLLLMFFFIRRRYK